jgi:hypothetical protein
MEGKASMRAVIAVPISENHSSLFIQESGWPRSFESHASALSRQVARFGNKTYLSSKIKTVALPDEGIKFNRRVTLDRAVVISKGEEVSVLVAAFTVSGIKDVISLRRLSLSENKEFFISKLGMKLDEKTSVFGLAVAESTDEKITCRDGLLVTKRSESDFVFDVIYMQALGALAFERALLEISTDVTFKPGILNLKAIRHLGELKHWLSFPSSDSTRLYEELELLRSSLKLDARREQVLRSLEQHLRRLSLTLTVFGVSSPVTLSIAQTLSFSTANDNLLRIVLSVFVSITNALIAWRLSRS